MIKTSKIYNARRDFIDGLSNHTIGLFALMAFVGYLVMKVLPFEELLSERARGFLGVLMTLGIPGAISYYFNDLTGGNYPYERLERWQQSLRRLGHRLINLNTEINIQTIGSRVFTPMGDEVVGFELTCQPEKLMDAYSVLFGGYKSLIDISVMRDTCRKGKYLDTKIYLVLTLRLGDEAFESDQKTISAHLSPLSIRLSFEQMTQLYKRIFNKGIESFAWEAEKGFFTSPIALMEQEALVHFGDIEDRALVLSMANIPDYVGSEYQKILNIINKLPSTTHLSLKPFVPDGPFSKKIEKALIERHYKTKLEPSPDDVTINVHFSLSAIIHGTKKELGDLMVELDRAVRTMPEQQKVYFNRENVYLKKALLSVIPGRGTRPLPSRRYFRVHSKKEALAYLPEAEQTGYKHPLFNMRTASNNTFGMSYDQDAPLFIWGQMGTGKTALMSSFVAAHLRQSYQGAKQNTFILTAGDGYDYLRDGEADLVMYYAYEGTNYAPLDFHPLALFLSLGSIGIEGAREWLTTILNIEDQFISDGIHSLLEEMHQDKLSSRKMSDFYKRFEGWALENWPENKTDQDHFSRRLIKRLYNFCGLKGSQFGALFEPPSPKMTTFSNIKTVLVTQRKGKEEASEGLTAFFTLATCFYNAWDLTLEKPLLMLVDELEHLFACKAITAKQVKSLATQGRKHAKYTVMSTQFLSFLFNHDLKDRFSHYLFADDASSDHLEAIMHLDTSTERREGGLKQFESTREAIKQLRPQKYAWGYIDKKGFVHTLIHDLDLETLWLVASHKPSRDLKSRMMARFDLNFFEAAKALALTGLTPPKKAGEYPKDEIIETMDVLILKNINKIKDLSDESQI